MRMYHVRVSWDSAGKGIVQGYRASVSCAGNRGVCNAKEAWAAIAKRVAIIVIFPQGKLYHLATAYCGKITWC